MTDTLSPPAIRQATPPLSREELIARYDARVPRYTSYPTANHFGPEVDCDVVGSWLAAIDPAHPVDLYVHLPFCARLCWFCGCNTRVINGRQPIADYVGWLRREVDLVRQRLPDGVCANGLHFGGGTPNLLSPDDLAEVFGVLREVFRLGADAEIGAELDPATLTETWVRAAASHGLNRASLGVQDLSPKVQAAVNRREGFDTIERSVRWLREAGVGSINLDLMYGLPHQTVDDVKATLDSVLTLAPERIAMFGYAHVPWMKPHQKLIDETALAGPAERLEMSLATGERLARAGYVAIGLDHYALPTDEMAIAARTGGLGRSFQGYVPKAAETLIGLGASAISHFPGGFAQNFTPELAWRQALEKGVHPVARGRILTDEDRFRGEIIARLMCDLSVDLGDICRDHGRDLASLEAEIGRLEPMVGDGLLDVADGRIVMTERGGPFVRAACAVFDPYLQPSAGRHAPAL